MTYLYPSSRGWGSGWPHCSVSLMVAIGDIKYDKGTVTALRYARARKEVVELARLLIAETANKGYDFKTGQCWGYNCRSVRGSSSPSFHSWGLALDFNSAFNWLGRADGGDIPAWMVSLWHDYGWGWGGNYTGRKDPMHFEFSGTPGNAKTQTDRASNNLGGDELTPEQENDLRRITAFIDAVTDPLKPGKDAATAAGAGSRVARATLAVEKDAQDPDGVDH